MKPSEPRTALAELTEDLFPEEVLVAGERLDSTGDVSFRFPEEAARVEGAILKRRLEHATGRRLAHGLLDRLRANDPALGPPSPLLAGADRAPVWPTGTHGSITHTRGICLVAVARTCDQPRLGLDVEVTAPLKDKLWPSVLTVSERARLRGLGARGRLLSMVHFSAKEAVYKLVARDVGRVLEFEEVELGVSLARGTFTATFLLDPDLVARLPQVHGRWRVTRDFVVTSALGS